MFTAIDDFLLSQAERFAHWFQQWTGLTNWFLARIASWLCIASLVGDCAAARTASNILINSLLILSGLVYVFFEADNEESIGISRIYRQTGNSAKISERWLRKLWIGMTVVFLPLSLSKVVHNGYDLHSRLLDFWSLCVMARLYFRACDPLPPCAGKIREALQSLKMQPVSVEER